MHDTSMYKLTALYLGFSIPWLFYMMKDMFYLENPRG